MRTGGGPIHRSKKPSKGSTVPALQHSWRSSSAVTCHSPIEYGLALRLL
jgi:hypothetical protein